MTNEHLAAMHAARAASAARRQATEDSQARAYLRWLADEAAAYGAFAAASDMHEMGAVVLKMRDAWRNLVLAMPAMPPDAAFKRVRGEA